MEKKPTKQKKIEVKPTKESLPVIKLVQGSYKYQTKEYFNNSTIHGVRYIVEEGRPFREKYVKVSFFSHSPNGSN